MIKPWPDQMLDNLNEAQKRVVTTLGVPLLVVAGPGTGKTLTIVHRIAYLVRQGVRPESILAVTFTNRAAREMKARTEALLGEEAHGLFIGTFHLLGLKIIKDSRREDFVIYNRDEQVELVKSLLTCAAKKALQTVEKISRIKNFLGDSGDETPLEYEIYQATLSRHNAHDFDDLILTPLEMLEQDNEVRKRYQNKFKYIIVDEYQDINPAQYRLLRILAGSSGNVCAVGDSDQAIYAFRGADVQNFLNFAKDFPRVERISLIENYRSTSTILHAGESVIKNNLKRIDRNLFSRQEIGADIGIISVPDERSEGTIIIKEIEARIGGTSNSQMIYGKRKQIDSNRPYRFSDFGIISRTNAQIKILEEEFSASGIPYQLIGRPCSLQTKEREESLAYLSSLIHNDDNMVLGSADTQEAKLLGPTDFFNPKADAVSLMTMHMAKGLEFSVVFIAGCEEGLIPYTLLKDGVDIEEERRLFYVGITRAMDELIVLHSRRRFLYGQRLEAAPSPFLSEIPETIMRYTVIPDKVKKHKGQDKQLGLF